MIEELRKYEVPFRIVSEGSVLVWAKDGDEAERLVREFDLYEGDEHVQWLCRDELEIDSADAEDVTDSEARRSAEAYFEDDSSIYYDEENWLSCVPGKEMRRRP